MRVTLRLDADVLAAARVIAARDGVSVGAVISVLARRALRATQGEAGNRTRLGLPLLPPGKHAGVVTMEMVNKLRDSLP